MIVPTLNRRDAIEVPTPKNGAKLIAASKISQTEYVVLCRYHDYEWVTWRMDLNGECYWGHYFHDLHDAVTNAFERAHLSNKVLH